MKYSVEEILKLKASGLSDEAIVAIVTGGSKSGNNSGTGSGAKKYSTDLKDYEPKKDKDGHYNWTSYNSKRTAYCYAVVTDGNCNSNPYDTAWAKAGNKVDYSPEGAYKKAKAEFEATYKRIKKADR